MPNHVKPTSEELEAMNKKLLEDLEKPDDTPPADIPPDDKPDDTPPPDDKPDDTPPADIPPDDKLPSPKELTPEEKLKERYRESTREAQRLYKNNVQINQAITDADSLPEPTEDELKSEFPEWAEMSATEQKLSTETLINKRFRETVKQAAQQQKKVDDWGTKVDTFVGDPKTLIANPDLEGKAEDFKVFASDKKLVGYEFDILVSSFLHGLAKAKVSHKGEEMLETPGGGPNELPVKKSTKLSIDESEKLRQTDYKKYKEELRAGNISTDLEE